MMSDVQKFYSGKTIFITGATGFLGQVLLSKLLCSCQEIRCIYVLIRESREKIVHARMKEIFDEPIYIPLKRQYPDYESKIRLIQGDCYKKGMGISDSDRAILEHEVNIVFHVAASVNFKSLLRESCYINLRSLDTLLDMAKNMKNLKAFMFVSTAYSACAKTQCIEEKFYDPAIKASNLLPLLEHLDDEVFDEIAPRLMNSYPNSYVFTKLVAEGLCKEKGSTLPLCIFRPAAVIPCYKEPVPGWTNNAYGAIGYTYGYALGIMRVAPVNKNYEANIIPGDYCVNALIISAYHTSLSWENKTFKLNTPIINYSSGNTKFRLTWGSYQKHGIKSLEKYPFYDMIPLPGVVLIKNYAVYRFLAIFLHLIPAVIFDAILSAFGKKPRIKKLYRKLHQFLDALSYFTTKNWIIISDNINEIYATLSDQDKELFYGDLNQLDVEEYFDNMMRGLRLYLAKDSEETVPRAVKKRRRFRIFYYSSAAVVISVFLYFVVDSSSLI